MSKGSIRAVIRACVAFTLLHDGYATAVTNERLPVAMRTTTVQFLLEAEHETGSYSTTLNGLPTFDVRLGSLDLIAIRENIFYDASGHWTIATQSNQGYGRYDTDLSINLFDWIQDSTSSVPFDVFAQDIHSQYNCRPCRPAIGVIAKHSFPTTFFEQFTVLTKESTGFRLTGTTASVTAFTVNVDKGMKLSVGYRWGGTLEITPTYTAYTTRQYLDQAVALTGNISGWYDRSGFVSHQMVEMRNLPDGSGSRNEALRTAEYGIMSYWAAQQYVLNPSVENYLSFWMQSPFGVAGHNAVKGCKLISSACNALLNYLNPPDTNALPSSSPGGTLGSGIAWIHGIEDPYGLEGLGLAMEARSTALWAPAQRFSKDGLSGVFGLYYESVLGNGVQRLPALSRETLLRQGADLTGSRTLTSLVAPTNATAFIVLALGNRISRLILPDMEGFQDISQFTLVIGETSYTLEGGVLYDLVALSGLAADGFVITDILGQYPAEGPAIDVAFANAGVVDLLQMSVTQAVPETPSQALMVGGLCLVLLAMRLRRPQTRASVIS